MAKAGPQLADDETEEPNWDSGLQGARLYLGGLGLAIPLFLTSLETTIVSTSLIAITDDLLGFGQGSWIISSYLLTYAGFLLIWSKASDIFGVRFCLIAAITLFTLFSAGCGAVRNVNQLIICRAFQGIGGSGVYSLSLFSIVRIVAKERYAAASAFGGGVFALGLVLGPLFGGAIAEHRNWRWVFLCNVPPGVVACLLVFFAIPSGFPNPPPPATEHTPLAQQFWTKVTLMIHRIDFPGATILLAASSLSIAALQEGNYGSSWQSGLVIGMLVVSGVSWILFPLWEWFLSHQAWSLEPMLPWRLARNRMFLGAAIGSFASGFVVTICVVEIPQRFQIVNNCTPVEAGVRLLAFAVTNPLGLILCSALLGRQIPFVYVALGSIILQVIGLFLLSELTPEVYLWPGQFGYLVLAGLGSGGALAAFYMMFPIVSRIEDQSVSIGTGLQVRMLGAALGIAAATSIQHEYVLEHLSLFLSPEAVDRILVSAQAIATLTSDEEVKTREVYAAAYGLQMKLAGAFAVVQFLGVALVWRRVNLRLTKS
ncbi:major facilitator superfamily domain-containing protein [Aspergillus karnatakaensis]|uniref:major facilitator superfamily domain-containing protein n=1 Tax=Aspergillus karnatakaensis TaxID=1810916 RepID=UPI003CCCEEB6